MQRDHTVYMCFSTGILHSGHIRIISEAAKYGKVIAGILTDEVVASYKRYPLLQYEERKALFGNLKNIWKVVEQDTLSYKKAIETYHPRYVIHGDDWLSGFQRPLRDEAEELLKAYGGEIIDLPYAKDKKYSDIENRMRAELSLPDLRRSRLKKLLGMKRPVVAMEAHSGLTSLLVEQTVIYQNGGAKQFDAIWVSSLCDSTEKGKPDIELVDMTSRFRTVDDIMEVTTKPIIFDGDTGGLKEHFIYTVRSLERMGVSMVIIEDKKGLKRNSLFGTEVRQTQETVEAFCDKIKAGKEAQKSKDFMICARIESLILEQGMDDALMRADAYVHAGADTIMIHSRRKDPDEIFEFVRRFRQKNFATPVVVVPTSFDTITEEEFSAIGVNLVIYANQLLRAGFPAMKAAAEQILTSHRALECDALCMPIKEIITLIPEE